MPVTNAQLATDPLGQRLVEVLRAGALPVPFEESFSDRLEVTVRGASAVGDLSILSDLEELTVYVGEHTHCHFSLSMHQDRSPAEAIDAVVQETVGFLDDLLADRIVVWSRSVGGGVPSAGGTFRRDTAPELLEPGSKAHLWSGTPFIPAAARGGA
jgi:hypothetical protein